MLRSTLLLPLLAAAAQAAPPAKCNADNCLRGIQRAGDAAFIFCSGFMATTVTEMAGLPTFLANCKTDVIGRASSACGCHVANYIPTGVVVSSTSSAPTASASAGPICNRDNCFRAMIGESASASSFCASFTATVQPTVTALPSFASNCALKAEAVSSACSCVAPAATSTSQPEPACTPVFSLEGVSESAFNAPNTPFTIKQSCGNLDAQADHAVLRHGGGPAPLAQLGNAIEGTTITAGSITVPGLPIGKHTLTVVATSQLGEPILGNFVLVVGGINMPVTLFNADGAPVAGVEVTADSTAYVGISQVGTTDENGLVTFKNLPSASMSLFAKTADNQIAFNGLAAQSSAFALRLLPFYPASDDTKFDSNDGLDGWTGGSVISKRDLFKREAMLTVSTNARPDLQLARSMPRVPQNTKAVYIKYKFQTNEWPKWYGSIYNDYYLVSVRSNKGRLVTDSKSMNGLGSGAFDAQGNTDWFTLQVPLNPDTEWVQFDVGVSNVADSALDSKVIVDTLGAVTCDACDSCAVCPGNTKCAATCQEPKLESCDFYESCAEQTVPCGTSGFALKNGKKTCYRFQSTIGDYSSAGRTKVWAMQKCIQKSLVEPIDSCSTNTCSGLSSAAAAAHPKCFEDNNVCDFSVDDVLQFILTANSDSFAAAGLSKVMTDKPACPATYVATIDDQVAQLKNLIISDPGNKSLHSAKIVVLGGLKKYFQKYISP